jgi:hypothetical protein
MSPLKFEWISLLIHSNFKGDIPLIPANFCINFVNIDFYVYLFGCRQLRLGY